MLSTGWALQTEYDRVDTAIKSEVMTFDACTAILDRFRCPAEFAQFAVDGVENAPRGFFKFGEDIVCYGRSSLVASGSTSDGNLLEALASTHKGPQDGSLPFNPDEVVENLLFERYAGATNGHAIKASLGKVGRAAYYLLRPVVPASLRVSLKKAYLSGWEKTPFPQWPVDVTVDLLLERLLERSLAKRENSRIPFIWFWPDGFDSCSIMTHDVETSVGRDFIGTLMEMDQAAGIKASFQIVPEERYQTSDGIFGEIRSCGFEVNVHDLNHDGHLFHNRRQFLARARKINEYIRQYQATGYRTGAMYRKQEWYDAFAFEYDMSVPNVAHLDPQHGGCCTVMPYFIGNILELPVTTIQDYFLFYILNDFSIEMWKRQIEAIRQRHGMISFIVHPDYIIEDRNRATYQTLLEHLVGLRETGSVWFALPGEVNRWWRQRRGMRLIPQGSGWKIEGEGHERACLAFAYLRDGKFAYCTGKSASAQTELI